MLFAYSETKIHPQNCDIRFLKVLQVSWFFILRTWGYLLDSSGRISPKLTVGLRYPNLAALFLLKHRRHYWRFSAKNAGLQFSPKDNSAAANVRIIAGYVPKHVQSWKKVRPGLLILSCNQITNAFALRLGMLWTRSPKPN